MKRRAILLMGSLLLLNVLACNLSGKPEPTAVALPTATTGPAATVPEPTTTFTTAPSLAATATSAPLTPTPLPARAEETTPRPPPEAPAAPTTLNVPLRVYNPLGVERAHEPVTSGLPLPRDLEMADPARLRLVDGDGRPVPAQFTPLARWGGAADDGSKPIRWLLIDFQAAVGPLDTAYYFLQEGGPGPMPAQPLTIDETDDALIVDTGVAWFRIRKADGGLTGPGLADPLLGRARSNGVEYLTSGPVDVRVALQGPMRASVHVAGAYRDASDTPLLEYTSRYWFYAGQSTVRLFHTVENNTPCPLGEDGQIDCYDIGCEGGVTFADLSIALPTGLGPGLAYQVGRLSGDLTADLVLYQDSSGTGYWDRYLEMTDWEGNPLDARPRLQSYVSFRGYRTTLGDEGIDHGDQAAGCLGIVGSSGSCTVLVPGFWQSFPKALRAAPDGAVEVGLFPDEFGPDGDAFTLRPGEHKTHEIAFALSADSASPVEGQEDAGRLFAQAPPEWYVESGAFGLTALPNDGDWPDHENYIRAQLDTAPTYEEWMDWSPNLLAAIERADFYGIFDHGDWPIDYEGYGVAPLNAKYDNDYGAWLQWARSGDARWFELAEALSRHVADVDILHTLHSPRHWSDGIAFGHSWHDEEGFANPHRNGGGNHPDTAYGMLGLLTAYYLTGYEKAYEAAMELADCIAYRLHNDASLCPYASDCSGEGYALAEGMYDAGCRPAANSLRIVVAAYRATADPRYLAVADALVDWARAEEQPYIHGPSGEDLAMRPWMLNMVLRALADYLEMRAEFGLPDTSHAQSTFLAYADWLRTWAWLDLEPIDAGPRAAYPYEWFLDDRQGDPGDEYALGNNVPAVNNWLLLGADAMAYAYRLSGDADYLERAATLFRTGSRDPWFEGDANTYAQSKETANSTSFGHIFLHEWGRK